MTHMEFGPSCQFQHSLSTKENSICWSICPVVLSLLSVPYTALLSFTGSALLCPALLYSAQLCSASSVLLCLALLALLCSAQLCWLYSALLISAGSAQLYWLCSAQLSSAKPWRRRIDWECLIPFSTDPKSVSKCVPLVPNQSQLTQSQRHSGYHSYH